MCEGGGSVVCEDGGVWCVGVWVCVCVCVLSMGDGWVGTCHACIHFMHACV